MIVWSIAGLSPDAIAQRMKHFDIGEVQCFKQEDKDQIMDIVDNYQTGRKVCQCDCCQAASCRAWLLFSYLVSCCL